MSNKPEIIDVVDENDEIIGQMDKDDLHSKSNILHREIGILIFNKQGQILLQQRSFTKKICPGKWSISTIGHVDSGETPLQAAHKELQEELGFDTELIFMDKIKGRIEDHVSFGYMYCGVYPQDTNMILQKEEVEQADFFEMEQISKMHDNGEMDDLSFHNIDRFHDQAHNLLFNQQDNMKKQQPSKTPIIIAIVLFFLFLLMISIGVIYLLTRSQEQKMCTLEYAPVCGVDGVTYSNTCMAGEVEIAYPGECGTGAIIPSEVPPGCKSWFDGCNTCSITENGQSVCTLMYCEEPGEFRCLEYFPD